MKKKILLLIALFAGMTSVFADNTISVKDVTVASGGTGSFDIELNNTDRVLALIIKYTLPEGIEVEELNPDSADYEAPTNARLNGHSVVVRQDGLGIFGTGTFKENSGTVLTVNFKAAKTLPVGDEITIKLTEIGATVKDAENNNVDAKIADTEFKILITDGVVLDENSTTAPKAEENVKVTVKRTIKANQWSTICLPFAMAEAQVKKAFGDDVQLGDFKGYETEEEGKLVTGILVNFEEVKNIEANRPYIIKVSAPVSEFTLEGVDIDPVDELINAAVERSKRQWSEMIGTYKAETVIPSCSLFLSDGAFWYSTGKTKIKAFRAYFDFYDAISEVEDEYGVKMRIVFGDATSIEIANDGTEKPETIYDLSGRRVEKATKGIYIINNKKVLVK